MSTLVTGPMSSAASARRRGAPTERAQRACPPSLTGGESTSAAACVDGGAKVDWLTVTFLPEADELVDRNIAHWLLPLLGGAGGESVNGFHSYANGLRFWHVADGSQINLGRLDWGGDKRAGRARLELTGHGCARVVDWDLLRAQLEQLTDATLTRVDLAVDVLDGEFTVDDAVDWYRAGEFTSNGRPPSHSTVGDWLDPEHPRGRTLEVGRRANGKMLRCYEKGRQLGEQKSAWVRFEVELRNNDRDLPFDMLTQRDSYFVGAYGALQRLLDASAERIKTHQREGEIALEVMTDYARTGYGQVLNVLRLTGLSMDEVFTEISRPGIPKRLEKAALLGFITAVDSPTLNRSA